MKNESEEDSKIEEGTEDSVETQETEEDRQKHISFAEHLWGSTDAIRDNVK